MRKVIDAITGGVLAAVAIIILTVMWNSFVHWRAPDFSFLLNSGPSRALVLSSILFALIIYWGRGEK